MRLALMGLLALGGCDAVFGLDVLALTRDASTDPLDASLDAPDDLPCVSNGFDEDSDGVADNCDLCPQRVEAGSDSDSDGDGIGNACDPDPDSTDVRIGFFGFNDAEPSLSLFADAGGSWSRADGRLTMTTTQQDGDYLARLDIMERDVTIETQFTISGQSVPTDHSHSVGLWADIDVTSPDPTFPRGFVFETVATWDATPTELHFSHLVDVGGTTSIDSPISPSLFAYGMPLRLRLTCAAASPTCLGTVSFGPGLASSTTIALPTGISRAGAVGLRVHGAIATFDYFAIYGRPH